MNKFLTRWSLFASSAGVCTIGGVGLDFRKACRIYVKDSRRFDTLIVVSLIAEEGCIFQSWTFHWGVEKQKFRYHETTS